MPKPVFYTRAPDHLAKLNQLWDEVQAIKAKVGMSGGEMAKYSAAPKTAQAAPAEPLKATTTRKRK